MQLQAEDLVTVRQRCKASLDAHRRRATADRQRLDFDLAALVETVTAAERCAYCGVPLTPATWTLDHKTPTCRAADYALGNLAVCCRPCNEAKDLLTAAEFRDLLHLLGGWHPRARQDLLARLRVGGRARGGR